jgi:hypothetical protein
LFVTIAIANSFILKWTVTPQRWVQCCHATFAMKRKYNRNNMGTDPLMERHKEQMKGDKKKNYNIFREIISEKKKNTVMSHEWTHPLPPTSLILYSLSIDHNRFD